MARSRVSSFISQLSSLRDFKTALPLSSSPPADKPAPYIASNSNPTPPSTSSPSPTATPPLSRRQRAVSLSSTDSTTEPFPEILPEHFPVAAPPTPPNDNDDCSNNRSSSSSPIHTIPEDGTSVPVTVSRSNSIANTGYKSRQRSCSAVSTYSTRERSSSRPSSIVQAYQPPVMDITEDTPPELQPTFTFLNNHGNKLYQEGYFLKLDDQNAQGRANADRTWHECFAQLVGTVLSLWDAAELDVAADEGGEVLPKFINITDASIKMIESLKISTDDNQQLQNILSISTAGRNRYLLHFNSHHSLIQWTSAIRLAIFEQSTLQEAYTGALIAGKARGLNNIGVIMERATNPTEDWVKVRFGAGVPWRRCWCVVTPPTAKELNKAHKEMKKKSPYDRSQPVLKGDIRFYDTRVEGKKQKKTKPIASITDAFAAYAIYPQAKSFIDVSTLIKLEGDITIHTDPPSSTEGFVFLMPEVHPAVSGFETLLRFLFPVWDTFALYGRPGKLVASPHDPRALMFAMPRHRKYGYLEILDVSGLVTSDGSDDWSDREWRKRLKELTGQRRAVMDENGGLDASDSRSSSRTGSRRSNRLSIVAGQLPSPLKLRVGFADSNLANRTSRSFSLTGPPAPRLDSPARGPRVDPQHGPFDGVMSNHARNSSDPEVVAGMPSRVGASFGPFDSLLRNTPPIRSHLRERVDTNASEGTSSDDERPLTPAPVLALEAMPQLEAPQPVKKPPAFNHDPQSRPLSNVYHSPDMRRANNRLSNTTLSQLAEAGRVAIDTDSISGASTSKTLNATESGIAVHLILGPLEASTNQSVSQGVNEDAVDGSPHPNPAMEPFLDVQGVYDDHYHWHDDMPPPIPPMNLHRAPQCPAPTAPPPGPPGVPVNMRPGPQSSAMPPPTLSRTSGTRGPPYGSPMRGPPGTPSSGMRPLPGLPGSLGPGPGPGSGPSSGFGSRMHDSPGPTSPPNRGQPRHVMGPGSPGPLATASFGGPMMHSPTTHRPGPYFQQEPPQRSSPQPLPQRTTSLDKGFGPVPRSATMDVPGVGRGPAHRQNSDQGGIRNRFLEEPRPGVLKTVGGDEVDSSTEYTVPSFEFGHDLAVNQAPSYSHHRPQHPQHHPSYGVQRPFSPVNRSLQAQSSPAQQISAEGERRFAMWQPSGSSAGSRIAPDQLAHQRVVSPGPGMQMPTTMPTTMPMSRPPPSPARSATYDAMGQPSRPFAQHESQRPGSSGGRLTGGVNMPHGLGIVGISGNLQRSTPQPVLHQPIQPQWPVIVEPSSHPRPHPLPPLPRTNRSPTRSPMTSTTPNLPSPMSATYEHVGSLSPPLATRVPSPLAGDFRPVSPPHGKYTVPSGPGTPKLPQFHRHAL